jgi:hypothetical protein
MASVVKLYPKLFSKLTSAAKLPIPEKKYAPINVFCWNFEKSLGWPPVKGAGELKVKPSNHSPDWRNENAHTPEYFTFPWTLKITAKQGKKIHNPSSSTQENQKEQKPTPS